MPYINKEDLLAKAKAKQNGVFAAPVILNLIEKAPEVDVVEVKHGEWIEYQTPNIICCSECDWGTGVDEKTFKFCPNCGAKMDLKEGAEK